MSQKRMATTYERHFCNLNKMTCCTSENIESVAAYFARAANKLQRSYEIVEELFILFKGPKLLDVLEQLKNSESCNSDLNTNMVVFEGQKVSVFDANFPQLLNEWTDDILVGLEEYVKNNIWFHSNLLCSACNPEQQKFFDLNEDGAQIIFNKSVCRRIFREKIFEQQLVSIYNQFLRPFAEATFCHFRDKMETNIFNNYIRNKIYKYSNWYKQQTDKYGQTDFDIEQFILMFSKLNSYDNQEIRAKSNLTFNCLSDIKLQSKACVDLCHRNLFAYTFPYEDIIHNLQLVLSILFLSMTGTPIETYYFYKKTHYWNLSEFKEPIYFYEPNQSSDFYKFELIEWFFEDLSGINLFDHTMTKKFIYHEFDSISIWLMMEVIVVVSALFII
jgi:hypothetical protein